MGKENTSNAIIIKAASACVWRGEDVLLVQRGKALGHGLWSLPGGRIEPDETAIAAAARELLEESGITASLQQHVGDFDLSAPGAHYVISCFAGFYVSGMARPMTDASAVAWVHWTNLATYRLAPNSGTAIRLARNLLSL